MADPLIPAGTQTGTPDPYQNMTPEEYQAALDEILAQPDTAPVGTPPEGAVPQMNGVEEKVWAEGYDPYAASKTERSAWETGVRKYTDIERSITGLGMVDGVSPTAIVGGAADRFLTETGRTFFDATNTLGITDVDTGKRVSYDDAGAVEGAASGILAYVASFAGYNKFLKTVGMGGKILRWSTAGALTDAFGQDPFAERFADLAKKSDIPGLDDNFVVNFFAAEGNEDDSVWEGRFKNAVEGQFVGIVIGKPVEWVVDKLWGVLKSNRAAYKAAAAGNETAANEAFEKAVEQADEVAKETGQPFFDADTMEWDSGSFYARRAAQATPTNSYYDIKSAPPVDPAFNPDNVGALGDITVNTPGPLPVQNGPFRSLEESMQALTQGQAAQDAAAVRVGTDGVNVGQATEEVAGTTQVGNMQARVYPDELDKGVPLMSATLPTPTAPRYSAFAKEAPPEATEAAGKAKGGKGTKVAGEATTATAGAPSPAIGGVRAGTGVIRATSEAAAKEFAANVGKDPAKAMLAFESAFNTNRWGTTDEVKEVIGQAAEVLRKEGIKIDQKTTQKEIMELSDMYLENPEVLVTRLALLAKTADHMPSIVVATKMMAASLGKRLVETSRKIVVHANSGMSTADLDEMFARDLSLLEGLIPPLTVVRHRGAVSTWAGNIQTVSTEVPEAILRTVKQFQGNRAVAQLVISRLPTEKVVEAAKRIMAHKSWDALIQWRTGALLYGPRTMITNIIGTGVWGVTKPGLRLLGSMIMLDGKTARHNLRVFAAMRSASADAMRMMKRSFVDNTSILDAPNGTIELHGRAFQELAGDSMQTAARFLDGVSTLPMRSLTAQDEFFKQIAYRSYMTAEGAGLADDLVKNGGLKEADVDAWVEKYVRDSFDADGSALNPTGLQYAREATFTQDLGPYGQAFQRAANAIPPLKLIFPFIRTPTNLLSEGIQLFPGANLLSKRYKEMAFGDDPQKRAEAVGKLAFGATIMGTAMYYAAMGQITGRAPGEPEARKRFLESGRLPYAFLDQSTGRWVQFNRMDPHAVPLGIAADLMNAYMHEGQDLGGAFAAAAIGIGDNLKSKSYLTGLADVMDIVGTGFMPNDDTRSEAFQRAIGKQVASMVPNFTSQLNPDDTLRETQGILDQTLNRLWLFGGDAGLSPKRDALGEPILKSGGWMFGEVPNFLSPFTMALPADSPVREQLYEAQVSIRKPPAKEGNIDFKQFRNAKGQTAYDRYLELTGDVTDGAGKTVKQRLEELVPQLQERFGDIKPQRTEENGFEYKSPIQESVMQLVGAYRKKAKAQLLQEFPELKRAILDDQRRARQGSRANAARLLQ